MLLLRQHRHLQEAALALVLGRTAGEIEHIAGHTPLQKQRDVQLALLPCAAESVAQDDRRPGTLRSLRRIEAAVNLQAFADHRVFLISFLPR